jgi:membrane fusion protein (multidrug efflux system)
MKVSALPQTRSSFWRVMIIMLVVTAIVLAAIFVTPIAKYLLFGGGYGGGASPSVSTITVAAETWQPQTDVVGTFTPVKGADLAFETAGVVSEIAFQSGQDVKEGTALVRLRAQDDISKLDSLKANAQQASLAWQRSQKLYAKEAVSQAQLQTDEANYKSAQAQVAEQEALVAKKVVRAPFNGRLGISLVNVGQYVSAGTAVVTLQSLDPIFLDFYIPQQSLGAMKAGQNVVVSVDAFPGKTFTGTLLAIDPKVDNATRNVKIRASLPNPEGNLLPGMYANAQINEGEPKSYITIPQTAVTFNPYGNSVYVVEEQADKDGKKQSKVAQRFITTGETRGDQIAVVGGLKAGETIVSAGQNKLQNGMTVTINNSIVPTNDPNPTPTGR